MKTIKNYIDDNFIQNEFIKEEINIISEDMMINESFQSSLLKQLAKKIYDVEDFTRKRDKEAQERWEADGYKGKRTPNAKSFSTIFGPIRTTNFRSKTTKTIKGVEWDKIKDSDFQKFMGYESKCKKAIKPIFAKGGQGLVIALDENTKDIIYFLKGYGDGKDFTPVTYTFNDNKEAGKEYQRGVKPIQRTRYSYQVRNLKLDEFMETINDYEVYVLIITDDMFKTYNDLVHDRAVSQEGVINFDQASLKRLLEQQQARYKATIKEIRTKKLMEDTNKVLEEIKQVNADVIKLYEKIISNPNYLDKYFDLGRLMQYVSYCYEEYYKYAKNDNKSVKEYQAAKAKGLSSEEAKGSSRYYSAEAKSYINSAKDSINKVRELIKEIEQNL